MNLFVVFTALGIVIFIAFFIGMKKDDKKQKDYRENHISEVIIKDHAFGEMRFEKDSKYNTFSCKDFKPSFGSYNPIIIIDDYDEVKHDLLFRSLEVLYGKQQEVIDTLFKGILESYQGEKEITRDSLMKNFIIEEISISPCGEYFLEDVVAMQTDNDEDFECEPTDYVIAVCGNPNGMNAFRNYYQLPMAYMDCKTKKICYVWEE